MTSATARSDRMKNGGEGAASRKQNEEKGVRAYLDARAAGRDATTSARPPTLDLCGEGGREGRGER